MKKTFVTLLFCFLSLRMIGQIDYLEPVKDFKTWTNELNGYYNSVFSLLNTGFSKQPYARCATLPSFSPEYAVSVESKAGKYYLISNTLSLNSWQAEPSKIKINTRSVEISKTVYQLLGDLLRLTIEQIQDLDGSTGGLDGITYYFTARNEKGEIITGEKWTPGRTTLMGRLVQIYEAAYSMSIGKNIPEYFIKDETQALIRDLKERNKAYPNEYKRPKYAGIFPVGLWESLESGRELDTMPQFPDSTPEGYVTRHLVFPSTLLAKVVKGYALCQFTVNKEGRIVNVFILRHSHSEFAKEALRVVKSIPQVVPAMSEGTPVSCNYVLYIPFRSTEVRR